jgi:hypothetical protein
MSFVKPFYTPYYLFYLFDKRYNMFIIFVQLQQLLFKLTIEYVFLHVNIPIYVMYNFLKNC